MSMTGRRQSLTASVRSSELGVSEVPPNPIYNRSTGVDLDGRLLAPYDLRVGCFDLDAVSAVAGLEKSS
jgi:hypothetical protein